MIKSHPDERHLADYATGNLAEDEASSIAEHLSECAECEATIQTLESKSDTLVSALRVQPAVEPYDDEAELRQAVAHAAQVSSLKADEPPAVSSADAASPRPATKAPPKLGPYQLLAKLGEGGMGAVFKARHEHLEKIVAIKVLPKKAMQDAGAVARFRREMKAVGALHHPNIVGAHDAGEQQGTHFLVMEYVEGKDLSSLIKQHGPVTIAQAISYMQQAAKGLAFAHSKNIVHRDIKPANLLVDGDGTVKILDLGLARLDDGGLANAEAQQGLTQTGQVMGTVDYMAPEQAFDTHRADAKADVYSLGCTLYRLLTGKNVFDGETIVQKILAHREQPIAPLAEALPEVPPALDALYRRMLAKRPEERPTMAEVATELETLQRSFITGLRGAALPSIAVAAANAGSGSGPRGKTASGNGRRPPLKLLAAGFGGAFILATIWFIVRDKDNKEIARIEAPEGSNVQVTATPPVSSGGTKPATTPAEATTITAQIATIAATPSGTAVRSTTPAASSTGYALNFGEGSIVEIPSLDGAFDPVKPLTVECWITPRFLPSVPRMQVDLSLAKFKGAVPLVGFNHQPPFYMIMNNSAGWAFYISTEERLDGDGRTPETKYTLKPERSAGGMRGAYVVANNEPGSRRWHLAAVRTENKLLMFTDGKLREQKDLPPVRLRLAQNSFALGGRFDPEDTYFHGQITEVRLSQAARYTQDFKPEMVLANEPDTIALYHFDEGSGTILHDASGNGHDGKIVGATWVQHDGRPISAVPTAKEQNP